MAFTEQEKQERLAKLKEDENWWKFTDSQRVFLEGMAQGLKPLDATKRAYPNNKSEKQSVLLTKTILATVGIQKILTTIGVDVTHPKLTKEDAVLVLTKDFWRTTDPEVRMKLAGLISKFEGWGKETEEEQPEEIDLNKLAAAIEKRKRKATNEQPS
jgi:hypothetical protein